MKEEYGSNEDAECEEDIGELSSQNFKENTYSVIKR